MEGVKLFAVTPSAVSTASVPQVKKSKRMARPARVSPILSLSLSLSLCFSATDAFQPTDTVCKDGTLTRIPVKPVACGFYLLFDPFSYEDQNLQLPTWRSTERHLETLILLRCRIFTIMQITLVKMLYI